MFRLFEDLEILTECTRIHGAKVIARYNITWGTQKGLEALAEFRSP
jgi:hypothetical protein